MTSALVTLENVSKVYRRRGWWGARRKPAATDARATTDQATNTGSTLALNCVNLEVQAGESLAIVGASGSGKTTLLKIMLGLSAPTRGSVRFGERLIRPKDDLMWLRRRTGVVFQDPYAAFNPRRTVGQSVIEPLEATAERRDSAQWRAKAERLLERMGLPGDAFDRYPAEFSGGQRQRIALARALVHEPDLLVGDEPVSALDVLVQNRLIDLLGELRRETGVTLVTVTHDLGVVARLADRVAVMRGGEIVELLPTETIFSAPQHPYTRELLAALPTLPDV